MMKKLLFLFSITFTFSTFSQEKNSLLWKISGNGLQKDSYLFGTMHVSEKIAFHLDDVFFESLLKSDFVALESDPTFWLDKMFESDEIGNQFGMLNSRNSYDFYNTPFKLEEPKQEELMFFLSREDMLLNGILYRTNQFAQNFQEDTYLDMFIYQSGKKFGKPIYSLEDYERSALLVKKAFADSNKEKPDLWVQKLFKKENYFNVMNNAYRDRNISLIDSLNVGMYTKNYMENMLYLRNEEMANNIDRIVKKGSLFSAIGAAHLAGDEGVINMLRRKGYTVTALTSQETNAAKTAKQKIEDKIIDTKFTSQTSEDGFFTANLPNKLYELTLANNTTYLCPDLVNGSYVIITRISTFSNLYNEEIKNKNLDRLLVETIPGEIISKKEINKQGINGLDIVNKTKTGDFQRYQIFFTPLEMIIFKMDGKKEYVKNYGNQFFESILFNQLDENFTNVSPTYGGFEVEVPNYYSFTNKKNIGSRLLQATDKNDNYYFVKEVTLNDINYIEEDDFELERIHNRFYKNHEFDINSGNFNKSGLQRNYTSKSKLKKSSNKYLHLKTVTNAGHYYLLGFLSINENTPQQFFDSFKITDFNYKEEKFEVQKDTSLYFTVNSSVKPSFINYYTKYNKEKNKSYKGFTRKSSYNSKANETVEIELNKKHDLTSYKNIDSLWKDVSYREIFKNLNKIVSDLIEPSEFKNSKILQVHQKKKGKDKNGYHYYQYLLKDSLSSKAIKVKHILAKGAVYELKTLIDTTKKESKFISDFYTSFTPKDTLLGKSLFEDKTAIFFDALKNKDSLVLGATRFVNFEESNANQLMDIVTNYEFANNQLEIKESLIKELGKFKKKKIQNFLENLYEKSFDNPDIQLAIIKNVADDKTKKSYQKFLELFEKDIPLTSSKFDISTLFLKLNDSLEVAQNLFPEILNYATINEYKEPIYELLAKLKEKQIVKSNDYKNYKTQILTEARIELKRQISKKINSKTNNYNSNSDKYKEDDLLNIYVKLLFPFREDKNVANFLTKLVYTDNFYVKSTYVVLRLENDKHLEKDLFNDLTEKINSRGVLYKKLNSIKKTSLFPLAYKTKEEIYKSYLFDQNQKQDLKDSIVFIEKREFIISNKKYETYFYKSKPHKNSKSYNKDWKLSFITFLRKEEIGIKAYQEETNNTIDETKPLKEIIDLSVEKIKLKNRKRVNLEENNYLDY